MLHSTVLVSCLDPRAEQIFARGLGEALPKPLVIHKEASSIVVNRTKKLRPRRGTLPRYYFPNPLILDHQLLITVAQALNDTKPDWLILYGIPNWKTLNRILNIPRLTGERVHLVSLVSEHNKVEFTLGGLEGLEDYVDIFYITYRDYKELSHHALKVLDHLTPRNQTNATEEQAAFI